MIIKVNGYDTTVELSEITYEELVKLAGKEGDPSVAYQGPWTGNDARRSGTMYAGCDPIKLEDGMKFTVLHTGNS